MAPLANIHEFTSTPRVQKRDGGQDPTTNVCITPCGCFTNSTDTSIAFCLETEWHITYPTKLRHGLSEIDHYLTVSSSDSDFDKCGWNFGESFSKASVHRASIFYKSTNGSLEIRPPNLLDRLQGAEHVFKSNYPSIEIFLILFFTLGWIPLWLLWACGAKCWKRAGRRHQDPMSTRKFSKPRRTTTSADQQVPETKPAPTTSRSSNATCPPPYKETDSRR